MSSYGSEDELASFESPEDALAPIILFCPCGAGPCRRGQTDSGRAYLICCIKEGFGSCGFFEWVDVEMFKLQDLVEQYNSEKLKFQSASRRHVQMLNAFIASYRRLRLLHEKTSHLKKMLLRIESQTACCEAETLEFGASCKEIAGEVAESQKRMQETSKKLGKEVDMFTKVPEN